MVHAGLTAHADIEATRELFPNSHYNLAIAYQPHALSGFLDVDILPDTAAPTDVLTLVSVAAVYVSSSSSLDLLGLGPRHSP
jgi:hypothetical protein